MSDEVSYVVSEDEVPVSSTAVEAPRFFDLKERGDSAELTFLDPDYVEGKQDKPPILILHEKCFKFREGDKFPSKVLCPRAIKQDCPICNHCETLEKGSKERGQLEAHGYHCYTVVRTGVVDDQGKEYPPAKQLRLTKTTQVADVISKAKEIAKLEKGPSAELQGLYGSTFVVTRGDDKKAARIGEIGSYIETPVLEDLIDDPTPFTPDAEGLFSLFEKNAADIQAFVDREFGTSAGPTVNTG